MRPALGRTSIVFALALPCAACGSSASPESGGAAASPAPSAAPSAAASAAPAPSATSPAPSSTTPAPTPPPADPFASTLTVYAIHAPRSQLNPSGLVWTTPGGLTRQVLLNEAGAAVLDFKHTIGHAAVRLDCAATATRAAGKFAGAMTNANDADFRDLVLTQQVGLGVMFEAVAGRLQNDAEIQADVDAAKTSGGMNYIRFGIDGDVCQKLLDYAAEYQKRGIDKLYGLAVRPLYGEGAGCSAFAMSFVELAGLDEPRFRKAWGFAVRVPMYTDPWVGSPEPLIGGSRNPGVQIPVTRVASLTRGWATPTEPGIDSAGWDPTQMNESIDALIDDTLAHPNGDKVEVNGKLRGLLLDRTHATPSAALMAGTFFQTP